MRNSSTEQALSVIEGGSPPGIADDLVPAIQHYIDAVVAPLREKILVQEAEIAALKAREPQPGRDGVGVVNMFIDQSGTLVHTLSDGTVREVGVVVGRAGNDGDIASLREKLLVHQTEIEALKAKEPQPGRDGLPGAPGPAGRATALQALTGSASMICNSSSTVRGVSPSSSLTVSGLRSCRQSSYLARFTGASIAQRPAMSVAIPCLSAGSIWCSKTDTCEKPGNGCKDWQLCVQTWSRRARRQVRLRGRGRAGFQGDRAGVVEIPARS